MAGRLLPEWSPRRALCLRWPWRSDIWPQQGGKAQQALIEFLRRCGPFLQQQELTVLVQVPPQFVAQATAQLPDFVTVQTCTFADIWLRDSGPFYCDNGSVRLPEFNGWEGLDPAFHDDLTGRQGLLDFFMLRAAHLPVTLEGGNLHTDGAGTAICVASGILTAGRNPGLTRQQLAQLLAEHFAIEQLIVLNSGLLRDETGGHADNLLTFLDSHTLAVCLPDSAEHPEYAVCRQAWDHLSERKNCQGTGYRMVPMPVPELQLSASEADSIVKKSGVYRRQSGMPLCASYCNGIRLHNAYLLPQFDCSEDALAVARIKEACPELTLITVPARDLLPGGGGWHCASHTVPR